MASATTSLAALFEGRPLTAGSQQLPVLLASRLPKVDPAKYGIPPKMAEALDSCNLYGVVAGLKACQNAGPSSAPTHRCAGPAWRRVFHSSRETCRPRSRFSGRQRVTA